MKILYSFLYLWVIFALLDPDPATQINADPDSQPWSPRIDVALMQDYGRHKGHQHNLLELEAEKVRARMVGALQQMKKFIEEMSETNRRLEQVP
jgi:hypothetical protein